MFPSERANEKENKQGSNKQTNSNKSKLESNMLAVQHVSWGQVMLFLHLFSIFSCNSINLLI